MIGAAALLGGALHEERHVEEVSEGSPLDERLDVPVNERERGCEDETDSRRW